MLYLSEQTKMMNLIVQLRGEREINKIVIREKSHELHHFHDIIERTQVSPKLVRPTGLQHKTSETSLISKQVFKKITCYLVLYDLNRLSHHHDHSHQLVILPNSIAGNTPQTSSTSRIQLPTTSSRLHVIHLTLTKCVLHYIWRRYLQSRTRLLHLLQVLRQL